MEASGVDALTAGLALVGAVILIAALLSGLIERSGLPQVGVFLALGAALGPAGLHVLDIGLESPVLRTVATLSLALVLFTDAVSLDIGEVRRHAKLALLLLGPGTLLTTVLVGLAGWGLLGLAPAAAAILGAALASTDPVLLRGLLRRRDVPASARQALRLESGLNDVMLLPIVLIAMVFVGRPETLALEAWAKLALDLFLLGPAAGILVGLFAVSTLETVRRRIGVRRDYESLYSLGVAFAAYAAAEAVHGSGFLAAFAAGLTIAVFDVELCDCFLEYGETTAELLLLFAFVLLGSSLIWTGFASLDWPTVAFVVAALLVRPVVLPVALKRVDISPTAGRLVSWFGARGLSSLLLVLLPVFAGVPGAERWFAVCSLVVLLSVVVHGGSLMLLGRRLDRRQAEADPVAPGTTLVPGEEAGEPTVAAAPEAAAPARSPETAPPGSPDSPAPAAAEAARAPAAGRRAGGNVIPLVPRLDAAPAPDVDTVNAATLRDPDLITLDELQARRARGERVVVLDVRSERTYEQSPLRPAGSVRLDPERPVDDARRQHVPRDAILAALCA